MGSSSFPLMIYLLYSSSFMPMIFRVKRRAAERNKWYGEWIKYRWKLVSGELPEAKNNLAQKGSHEISSQNNKRCTLLLASPQAAGKISIDSWPLASLLLVECFSKSHHSRIYIRVIDNEPLEPVRCENLFSREFLSNLGWRLLTAYITKFLSQRFAKICYHGNQSQVFRLRKRVTN